MLAPSMVKISETYQQLSDLFNSLELAHFEEGKDFGENLTGCFQWFISPPAVVFLEKRNIIFWEELKRNTRFSWKMESWHGYNSQAIDIKLVL